LPQPLVGSTLVAPFIKFYREEFALHFLAPLLQFGSYDMSTEPLQSELLTLFPKALANPDILNGVRVQHNYVLFKFNSSCFILIFAISKNTGQLFLG
jgi:hypothetical protein